MNKSNVLLNLQKYWQYFVIWMNSGSDLQVWYESDRRGNTSSWHAYDPITGRSACFGSEEEMRIWIDKCYYR
ncbi:hypothetical protein H6G97_19580 [Nostoc flagelliforme FACHB-838]|uniref:Uncharacterized protein n=1 Tax=Nostoc flagelliforme FACHB-838 TaxID=2692904 RepID=A0ABR8DS75_9NOSO|nr:hypothetical protein [Nostoc flagelliforme]MBD2531672.1 hypothetical protein [Nostoc flagelliforme FACHB-838]